MEFLLQLLINLMTIASVPQMGVKITNPSDCYNPRVGPMAYDVSVSCGNNLGGSTECVTFEQIPQAIVDNIPAGCLPLVTSIRR